MPRFIAVHTMPVTEEQLMALAVNPPQMPPGIACNYTWCNFDEQKFFCEWEAPAKEIVEKSLKELSMPFEAVYAVRLLDWAKKEIEP